MQKLKLSFLNVLLLNGQNPEGESLQHFIHAITQELFSEELSADNAANHLVQWAKNQCAENHFYYKPLQG